MSVINTNVNSLVAQNALVANDRKLSKSMQQLSTGYRINGAADDAAGLAISNRMSSQIRGLNQAIRNANDGISLLQVAEGALVEVTNMMQRMRELAVQSANDTNGTEDRTYLNLEFTALRDEINRVIDKTTWNGKNLLDGTEGLSADGTFTFHVGPDSNDTLAHTITGLQTQTADGSVTAATTVTAEVQTTKVTVNSAYSDGDVITVNVDTKQFQFEVTSADSTAALVASGIAGLIGTQVPGVTVAASASTFEFVGTADVGPYEFSISDNGGELASIAALSITNQANSETAISGLDSALENINSQRASLGAVINRLTSAASNLANISQNTSASRSRILDADYASTTTELARTQIIQQAATAMLAQANQAPQTVLSLLK